MLSLEHAWWALSMACIIWFSTVTVYVAIRGASDIRRMLERLKQLHAEEHDNE